MGTGKTATGCAVIRHLRQPTLVLAPAISLTAWRRMGALLKVEFDVINPEMVRTGRTPYGQWQNPKPPGKTPEEFWCTSCQLQVEPAKFRPCPHHRAGIHCVVTKRKPHDYGKFIWSPAIRFLVVDEVHRYGGLDSLNADLLLAAKRQNLLTLALSATAADSPLSLRALGYLLDMHRLVGDDSFYRFAFRHGCKKHPFGGLYFGGSDDDRKAHMAKLHSELFPSRGVRVRIADLGAAFPPRQIFAELYDLKENDQINRLYEQMDDAIRELNKLTVGCPGANHPLTQLLRKRQELELLKVPLFVELTNDAMSNGHHVAVFVNFKQTLAELSKRLKTNCLIVGGQSPKERQNNLDRYQADEEPVILLNAAAGEVSISLHDTRGNFPRTGIVSLGYSSRGTRQICGRLWREGGKSKAIYRFPLAANTVEEKIHRAMVGKLNQIDCLNDADLWAANLPLSRHSVSEIFES